MGGWRGDTNNFRRQKMGHLHRNIGEVGGGGGGGGGRGQGGLGPPPIIVEGAEPTYPLSPPPPPPPPPINPPTSHIFLQFLCEAVKSRSQISKIKVQMIIYVLFSLPGQKGHSNVCVVPIVCQH